MWEQDHIMFCKRSLIPYYRVGSTSVLLTQYCILVILNCNGYIQQTALPFSELGLVRELAPSIWTILPVLALSQCSQTALMTLTLLTVDIMKMLVCAAVACVSSTLITVTFCMFDPLNMHITGIQYILTG